MDKKISVEQLLTCDKRATGDYARQLTDEEKSTLAEDIVQVSMEEDEKKEAKKQITSEYNGALKMLAAERKELIRRKRTGMIDEHGDTFIFFNTDERMKYTYNSTGEQVRKERMTSDDFEEARQQSILNQPGIYPITKAAN